MPLGDAVLFRDSSAVSTTGASISVPKPALAVDGDGINLELIWWSASDGGGGADIETVLTTGLGTAGVNYFHSADAFEVNPGTHWVHHERLTFTAQTSDTTYDFTLPGDALRYTFGVASAVIPDDTGSVSSGYGITGAGAPWTDDADLNVFFGSHAWGALTQGFVVAHIYAAESYTGTGVAATEGDGNMTLDAQDTPASGQVTFTYWDRPKGMAGNASLFADFTATGNTSGYYMGLSGAHQGDYPPAFRPEPPGEISLVPRSRRVRIQELPYNVGGMTPRRR